MYPFQTSDPLNWGCKKMVSVANSEVIGRAAED